MAEMTYYHYPRCSKSRKALALLREQGFEPKIVKYRKNPPSTEELDEILQMLDMEPRELMRKKEGPYEVLDLDDESKTREELIEAMVDNPILIQRPILVADGKAALGRPPENVLDIV